MALPRVLFVNQTGVMSGAEYVLANLSSAWPSASAFLFEGGPLEEALRRNGLQVMVAPEGARLGSIKRDQSLFSALPLASRLLRLIGAVASAARAHDVVYANSQKAFLLAALASFLHGRPLVWHLHDIMDDRHFGGAQRTLQIGLANRRAKSVIVPSRAAADAFVKAGGRPGLVHVVPNGIDLAPPPIRSRADLGLPEGPLVGVFSRLAPWKGQHVVVDALRSLPELNCILVGSALFGEDAYGEKLMQHVQEAGLSDRVHFLGQRNDVRVLMQAVDVVIHPSVDPEPFGLTLVEAMSVGTPLIATDAGAASEILEEGRAGYLIPPGDPAALADALNHYLADSGPFRDRARHGLSRVDALYGLSTMHEAVSGIVTRAAEG